MFEDLQTSPLYLFGSISLGIVVPTVCGFLTVFYKCPEYLVRWGFRYQMFRSGMKERFVQSGSKIFCYGEKNHLKPDEPSIVFIHGFTSSKLQWLTAFKGLRTDRHMIAMDLPGHGESSSPDEETLLDIEFWVSSISLFLDLVGLSHTKVDIVGISLGGAIVGVFAAHHPDKVAKVSMLCPAMIPPVETEFIRSLKESIKKDASEITYEDCLLLPQDRKGMKEMFAMCIYNKQVVNNIHPQIYQGFLNIRLRNNSFFLRLFQATKPEHLTSLIDLAPDITMPSQIIWGDHDMILDCSGAEYLQKQLPDCRHCDIFENCGHAIDIDRPGAFCQALGKFIMEE